MRRPLLNAGCAALLLAAGCSRDAAPTPQAVPGAPLAYVVYTAGGGGGPQKILAALEDGSTEPVALSAAGVDTLWAAELAGHRALLVERDGSGRLVRLVAAGAADGSRAPIAPLPAGYQAAGKVLVDGDAIALELVSAADLRRTDVYAIEGGAAVLVGKDATLAALAAGRVAFLQGGALRSAALDGSAAIDLGGGDDAVAEVKGSDLLVTVRDAGVANVRLVSIDGARRVAFEGPPQGDQTAFAIADGRAVLVRRGAGGATLVAAPLAGGPAVTLAPAFADVQPVAVTEGRVLFTTPDGALRAASLAGGDVRVLDPTAGEIIAFRAAAGHVAYTVRGDIGLALRAASLDGARLVTLCDRPLWLPFLMGIVDGRVVFHRALAGQLEGGQVFSVDLAGGDLQALGTDVVGDAFAWPAMDQDFEIITPAGRVIFEAEFEGLLDTRLLSATAGNAKAWRVTSATRIRFAGLVR